MRTRLDDEACNWALAELLLPAIAFSLAASVFLGVMLLFDFHEAIPQIVTFLVGALAGWAVLLYLAVS